MDGGPEESPKKEASPCRMETDSSDLDAIGDQGCSTSSDPCLQSREPEELSTTPEGDLASKASTSNRVASFLELRPQQSEFDEEDNYDLEIEVGQFAPFSKRRTFSQCDSPTNTLQECRIYDSEAKNKEMGSSAYDKNLQKFMVESATLSRVRRRFKPMRAQRDVKSDGAAVSMAYYTREAETSTQLLLKRSLSAPPDSSSETTQKQKIQIKSFFQRLVRSASKSKQSGTGSLEVSLYKTRQSSENSADSCSAEIVGSSSPSARTSDSDIGRTSEKTKEPCSVVAYESELAPDDTNTPSTTDMTELSPDNTEETNMQAEPDSELSAAAPCTQTPGLLYRLLTSEASCKSKYSELCGGAPRYPTGGSLDIATSSSENSEVSRIIDESTDSSQQCSEVSSTGSMYSTQNSSTDSADHRPSPPQITSEPPSGASSAIKVPTKTPDARTPELLAFPGPSRADDDNASVSGSGRRRPTDFNVKRRSAFYSFCSSSPTGLVLRPYRSMPNVHRPPQKNSERRSTGLENRRRGVVRSLFMGNFNIRGYTPGSNVSSVSKEILSLERRPSDSSSDERPSTSKGHDSKGKTKVCKKLVFSPTPKETNVTRTLQDHSSSELIGEISSLSLNTPSTSEDHPKEVPTPKRKEVSPLPTENVGTPVKKPRSSSEFRAKGTSGNLGPEAKEEEPANLLVRPSGGASSTKEHASPKRKVDDLNVNKNPGVTPADDQSPESALKRSRIKSPTPVDEVDTVESMEETEEEPEEKPEE